MGVQGYRRTARPTGAWKKTPTFPLHPEPRGRILHLWPRQELVSSLVLDATPGVVAACTINRVQLLLARIRHGRLVGSFCGFEAHSLQTNLEIGCLDSGSVVIDEIYVGHCPEGVAHVVSLQVTDDGRCVKQLVEHRLGFCRREFPRMVCRPVSAQFMSPDRIAMFELGVQDGDIRVVSEEHFELVPAAKIGDADLALYAQRKRTR